MGCEIHGIHCDGLKVGDPCPACFQAGANGKLYALPPGKLIRLEGSPSIIGQRYEVEKLRCALCGETYQATIPESIANAPKYAPSVKSRIAVNRYGMGLPHKRQEQFQSYQGIPLADSTQWDLMVQLMKAVTPVWAALSVLSASSPIHYYDDTPNRILRLGQPVHTTALVSDHQGHEVVLFLTGPGCGVKKILPIIKQHTRQFITMCDASSANYTEVEETLAARWIICFCLVHGRRKFFELLNSFPEVSQFVIDQIAKVYEHDAHCKRAGYTPEERLRYHQEHSGPVMAALHDYLVTQFFYPHQSNNVEPNSPLGEAMAYLLRHWSALTQFLKVAGAPLDNSLAERTIKMAIRHRKNSLFFNSPRGAETGDCLMSLIYTAMRNGVDPFDYLTTLQCYRRAVEADPMSWLPWCYQATLAALEKPVAA